MSWRDVLTKGAVLAVRAVEGKIARVKVRLGVGDDGEVPLMQHFGFASRPPPGAQVVVAAIGDERSDSVAIASSHRDYLFHLDDDGNAVIYDSRGQSILLSPDGITVTSGVKVLIDCPNVSILDGVTDEPVPLGQSLLTWLNTHAHPPTGGPPTTLATEAILAVEPSP